MASISSRTMRSTLRKTRKPSGSQVNPPGAARRMYPPRATSRWLGTSASAGSSRRVRRNRVDIRNSTGGVSQARRAVSPAGPEETRSIVGTVTAAVPAGGVVAGAVVGTVTATVPAGGVIPGTVVGTVTATVPAGGVIPGTVVGTVTATVPAGGVIPGTVVGTVT